MKKSISGFKARRSDRFYEQSRSVFNMEIEFQMTHLKDSEIDFGNHRVASRRNNGSRKTLTLFKNNILLPASSSFFS